MLRELAIMNKLYHVLFTMCYLASSSTYASCGKRGSFIVKPVGNITLHKRTLSGITEQSSYLGNSDQTPLNTLTFEQLVRNFVNHPFALNYDYYQATSDYFDIYPNANVISFYDGAFGTFPYGDYVSTHDTGEYGVYKPILPGEVFLDYTLTLKKYFNNSYGQTLATEDDAILGSKIYFVDTPTATGGEQKIAVFNLGGVNNTGTELALYPIINDGLTHKNPVDNTSINSPGLLTHGQSVVPSYSVDGEGTLKFKISPSTDWVTWMNLEPKLFSQPRDLNKRYYFLNVTSLKSTLNDTQEEEIEKLFLETDGAYYGPSPWATNNYRHLIADLYFNSTTQWGATSNYTQKDYDQVNYFSLDLGVSGEYSISDFLTISGYAGLSSPIESIEHNGRFIELNPEIELTAKAGVMFGNQNGSIGFMYGLNYERFSTTLKRLTQIYETAGATFGPLASTRVTQNFQEIYAISSIIAVIKVTDSLEATFSTAISEKDLSIEMSDVQNTSLINQAYSIGVSLCL